MNIIDDPQRLHYVFRAISQSAKRTGERQMLLKNVKETCETIVWGSALIIVIALCGLAWGSRVTHGADMIVYSFVYGGFAVVLLIPSSIGWAVSHFMMARREHE